MLLSIIIVNYNVKYFLEQSLCSVEKALRAAPLQAEIFVVDNHSSDGSADWLPGRFPRVRFILNSDNKGFGAANNQALARAQGKYILFLNPDTILPEDSFSTCISFMDAHPEAGAVGLRMIDGSGRFLKESRRGFPSPWVAFCKMAGLTTLFPRSAAFAKYYLGHIPSTTDHPSPILPGAYMFVRKQALDQTGGFDERFFLYAEDIDLSHRIEQAGYTNYYIASATLLHFKGESTQKDTRYIKQFYKAMSQFRSKHSRGLGSRLFNALLKGAIWGRAGLQMIANSLPPTRPAHSTQNTVDRDAQFASPPRRIWVCGDEQEAAHLRALLFDRPNHSLSAGAAPVLPARNRVPASGLGDADEIIFCEGPGYSFKEIIAAIEQGATERGRPGHPGGDPLYKIHAAGSASAAGSPSKKERGDTIVL